MSLRFVLSVTTLFFVSLAHGAGVTGLTDMLWAKDLWAKSKSCARQTKVEDPYDYQNYVEEIITYSIAGKPKHGFASADQENLDFYNATHNFHILFANDLTLPVFENYRKIAPSHRNALDTYYGVVINGRKFSDSRMDWIYRVEEELPLNRVRMYQIRDITTGKLYGAIRVFDATTVVSVPMRPLAKDIDYLAPVERSLKIRGASTSVIQKIRDQFPKAKIFEYGKAFKDQSLYGVVAKANWELSIVDRALLSEFDEGGFIFMHTDRAGAILYQRDYGARVVQAIKTTEGKIQVVDQVSALRTDPPETEYILMADTDTFTRTVLARFETDPEKSKLMENENFKKHVENLKTNIDRKYEIREQLKKLVPPRGPNEGPDFYKKAQ